MGIDWTKAPEWANYVAMDKNADWYWYEVEPQTSFDEWSAAGRLARANDDMDWKKTLTKRP